MIDVPIVDVHPNGEERHRGASLSRCIVFARACDSGESILREFQVRPIRRLNKIRKLIRHLDAGYSWLRSVDCQRPFGPSGEPVPWIVYGAYRFLASFDWTGARIGECGGGWSTLWWLGQGACVECVEADGRWADEIERMAGPSADRLVLHRASSESAIADRVADFSSKVDVLVVDGEFRTRCAEVASELIRSDSIAIVDNSDWYGDAVEAFRRRGRFEIPFEGLGPCTDIFTRTSVLFDSMSWIRDRPRRSIGSTPAGRAHVFR